MAKKIGELLVERGLLTPPQVEQGLESQKFYGGRIGSVWVQLGLVQEKDLLDALCAQKKARPAKASLLKAVTKATLDLLPVKIAVKYKVIPLVREGRRLTVAMVDPNDLLALDELQFISGSVVEPFLATERTILNALEKYYGVVQQKRDALATDLKSGGSPLKTVAPVAPPTSAAPKGPQPGLFLDDAARADAEAARKFWAEQLKSGGSPAATPAAGMVTSSPPASAPPPLSGALEDATRVDGSITDPGRGAHRAATAHAAAPPAADEVVDGNDLLVDDSDTVAMGEPPNPLDEASRRLSKVEIRDDIAEVLMWCTDGLFKRSALFIFQKSRTLGWTGQGEDLTQDMVRRVVAPVEEITIFTLVRDTPTHYQGPLPKNPGNEKLVETMGGTWPSGVLVIPFGIKGRALGCLYAEDDVAELATIDLPLLFRLLQKSGLALEILLLRSKLLML